MTKKMKIFSEITPHAAFWFFEGSYYEIPFKTLF